MFSKKAKTITACAACAAALGLGSYLFLLNKDKEDTPLPSENSEEVTEATEAAVELPNDWADKYGYTPSATGMTGRAKSLLRISKDIVGWIQLDNTQMDYPVVLDPGEVQENDIYYGPEYYIPDSYYLDHDIDRSSRMEGAIFADFCNVLGSDETELSDNMVVYGHAMWDGSMMGDLRKYRINPEFYYSSPFIKLSSNYGDYDYVIFSYLITPGSYYATDFHYWQMEDLEKEEDFNFYIDNCKRSQLIDTGVDVKFGDKLMTLSTCYADEDNSRFIVVARKLREGEVAGDLKTIQHTEAYDQAQKEKEEAEKNEIAAETQQ